MGMKKALGAVGNRTTTFGKRPSTDDARNAIQMKLALGGVYRLSSVELSETDLTEATRSDLPMLGAKEHIINHVVLVAHILVADFANETMRMPIALIDLYHGHTERSNVVVAFLTIERVSQRLQEAHGVRSDAFSNLQIPVD
eukprot:TRINITY_DN10461_c0_g1_i5.p2 TRINITY_DN10461_c0_g1~~TRINITY_DN10461_c0_g1_i5.p2  ORF type:complete len:142 (-),score=7.21 TRINITY_DN10461_c0_g1_i5:39-464(-)